MMIKRILFVFISLIILSNTAHAVTRWVDATSGSNTTGDGSEGDPYQTIAFAYGLSNAGDTVMVKDGVYTESASNAAGIVFDRDGSSGLPITIKSENRGGAIIDGNDNSSRNRMLELRGDWNVFDGFHITDSYNMNIVVEANNVSVINNEISFGGNQYPEPIEAGGPHGIFVGGSRSNILIANNYIHDIGRPTCVSNPTECRYDHGMYVLGDNMTIVNNVIVHNSANGIQFFGDFTITNAKVYNNTIAFNGRNGIILWEDFAGIEVYNNIMHDNANIGIATFNATGSGALFDANVVNGNAAGNFDMSGGSISYTLGTHINSNPLFVNEANDFYLQSDSPAIDAGLTLTEANPDIVGTTRPSGDYDIGAYEFVAGGADTEAPDQPTNLVATATSSSTISLTWTASTDNVGVTGYQVERCVGVGCSTWALVGSPSTNSFGDTGLIYDTTYNYQVRALDAASNPSAYSTADDAITDDVDISSFLVAHYLFDSNANSETGSHHASNVGTPTYVDGQIDQAISFNGTSSALSVSHDTALSITGDMTVSFWLYANSLPGTSQVVKIIQKESGSTESAPYVIDISNTSGTITFIWYHHTDGLSYTSILDFTGYEVVDSDWIHVLFVRRVANKEVDLYINGSFVESQVWTTDNPASNTGVMSIGYNSLASSQWLNGLLDEMRIYSMALNEGDAFSLSQITPTSAAIFADNPTTPSDSASATPQFPGAATTPSDSASGTSQFPGASTTPSDSASATPSFPGVPTLP